jgi:hypothetical protein
MRLAVSGLFLALAAHVAGCTDQSTRGTVLTDDYAPGFEGQWTGRLTVKGGGQTTSGYAWVRLTRTEANTLAVDDLYPGCSLTGVVSGPSTLYLPPATCELPSTTPACARELSISTGDATRTGRSLSMHATGILRDCNSSGGIDLTFEGQVPNRAPSVTVTLSPAEPGPADAIVATIDARDPDGDPVTLAMSWQVNGTLVADQTTTTLPAGVASYGDLVVIAVTASDGEARTTAEATVTLKSPAITGPVPARIGPGETLSVQLVIAGGTPSLGGFELEYGPAGMAVSSEGLVTWRPALPTFGTGLDVAFAVRMAAAPRVRFSGSVHVDDAGGTPLYRTGLEPPLGHAGLLVQDLDGDGRAEILVANRRGVFEVGRDGAGYDIRWAYPYGFASDPQAIAAGDVDGDGLLEIFVAAGDTIARLDGATRREAAVVRLPASVVSSAGGCADLRAVDVDGDGALDLVCVVSDRWSTGPGTLLVLDASTLTIEWQTAALAGLGSSVAVGNVDHDPALEIVTSGGYVFDGSTRANEWAYAGGFGAAVGTGDLDGDGVDEIVGMQAWDTFRGYSAVAKSSLWEMTRFNSGALHVADLDGDGRAEVVIGDAQWGNVTAFRYDLATNTLTSIFDMARQGSVYAVGAGDVDGDGTTELVWTGASMVDFGADSLFVAGLSSSTAVEWTNTAPAQLDGPFVGGRLLRQGAAGNRLVWAVPRTNSGYDGTRLLTLDPATGHVDVSAELGSNWNGVVALDVTDFDSDAIDELYLSTSDLYDGYLQAYDLARGAVWTSPKLTTFGAGAVAVVAADLDGDAIAELVGMASDGHVVIYDPMAQTLVWSGVGMGSTGVDVAVADLDHDGTPEIVALANSRVIVYRASGGAVPYLEAASAVIASGVDLLVADCDGDGTAEIYVLSASSWSYSGAKLLRFDTSLVKTGEATLDGSARSIHLEDLGVGRKNVVVSVAPSYSAPAGASYIEAIDPTSGATVWRSPNLEGAVPLNSLSYVDLVGDGAPYLVFGTDKGMYATR